MHWIFLYVEERCNADSCNPARLVELHPPDLYRINFVTVPEVQALILRLA